MHSRAYDLVIFDLDGTLVDNREAILEAYHEMLKEFGYKSPAREWVYTRIGLPLDGTMRIISNNAGDEIVGKMIDSFRDHYFRNCDKGVKLLDGAEWILKYLKDNGFKTGLASTKADSGVQELIRRMRIDGFFDIATGLKSEFRPKPDPSQLLYIIERLGVDKRRTMYVGDTPVDMVAARNAGVRSVAVVTGIDAGATTLQELKASRPDIMVRSLREITSYLY